MDNSQRDYLAELWGGMGEPGQQAVLDAGLAPIQLDLAKQRLSTGLGMGGRLIDQGESMSQTPGAKGMTVGPHNVYIASSPLEHAAVAMARIMGQRKMEEGRNQQAAAEKKAAQDQADLMAKIMAGQRAFFSGMKLQGQPMLGPEAPPAYETPLPPGYAFPSYGE